MVILQEEQTGAEALVSKLGEELSGWKRIVILGIGNEFSGDDGLGSRAALKLKRALSNTPRIDVIATGTSPENFTGLLRKLSPSHVVLIDAAELGETAGAIELIEPHRIEKRIPSTHTMPLYMLTEYLEQELGAKVLILGIQPESLSFGTTVSSEVGVSIDRLARLLVQVVNRR
jgi:hydrogenase 3 maturation protease